MSPLARFERRILARFESRPNRAGALRDALLVEGHGHLSEAVALGDTDRADACRLGLAAIEAAYAARRRPARRNRRRNSHRSRAAA